MMYQIKSVLITERGWAGHFICSNKCCFRRNTLLEYNGIQVVVSTVGAMVGRGINSCEREWETIGYNRYYETMAFSAKEDNGYIEADVNKEIDFSSNWCIDHIGNGSDNEANDMHDKVCLEIVDMLIEDRIKVE